MSLLSSTNPPFGPGPKLSGEEGVQPWEQSPCPEADASCAWRPLSVPHGSHPSPAPPCPPPPASGPRSPGSGAPGGSARQKPPGSGVRRPSGDERSRLHCQSALQPDGAAAELAVDPPLPALRWCERWDEDDLHSDGGWGTRRSAGEISDAAAAPNESGIPKLRPPTPNPPHERLGGLLLCQPQPDRPAHLCDHHARLPGRGVHRRGPQGADRGGSVCVPLLCPLWGAGTHVTPSRGCHMAAQWEAAPKLHWPSAPEVEQGGDRGFLQPARESLELPSAWGSPRSGGYCLERDPGAHGTQESPSPPSPGSGPGSGCGMTGLAVRCGLAFLFLSASLGAIGYVHWKSRDRPAGRTYNIVLRGL
nr:basic proline-rich protein-like [Caretta caretta]